MVLTVSINGADNVGKTTQIALLPCRYSILLPGSLHESDEKLGSLHRNGLLKEWWWGSPDDEFVSTIFSALRDRFSASMASKQKAMAVFDRGSAMFKAVAVATIAVKNKDYELIDARKRVEEILHDKDIPVFAEHLAILLKHGDDIDESVNITLAREVEPEDARYRTYQTLLQTELQHQQECGVYHHVIIAGPADTHIEVQDKIRATINSSCPSILPQPLPPVLGKLSTVYAFGGLSESGKSTLAQSLCNYYKPGLAFRTKIAYFLDQASEKLRQSVYSLTEKEQATMFLHELEDFSNRHYWINAISIESLHKDVMTSWLKTWMGDKFQIIYVETADDLRYKRSLIPYEDIVRNDATKRERGAERIKSTANLVLDNNGSIDRTLEQLYAFVRAIGHHNTGSD
jgi:hypothetical protein